MSSKKVQTTKQSSTQTAAPPSWTAPGLEQTAGMVTGGLSQIPTEHYSGQQVAYMTPEQQAGIQGAWGETADLAGYYTDWMGEQLPTLTAPWDWSTDLGGLQAYDVGSLYDVQPVINASLTPVYRQLTEQVLPGISSSALDAGAYTSDRAMGVLPMQAITAYSREAADIATQIGYQNYLDYENRRLAAWQAWQDDILGAYSAESERGLGQQSINQGNLGAINDYVSGILRNSASVGDLLNMSAGLGVANEQASINDALARDKYASYSPFLGLDQATQLLMNLSGGYGTETLDGTSRTVNKTTGPMEAIKAGIGIASMIAGAVTGNPLAMMGGAQGVMGSGGGSGPITVTGGPPMNASSIFGTG